MTDVWGGAWGESWGAAWSAGQTDRDQPIAVGYPDGKRKRRRRGKNIDRALEQTFDYLRAREDYRREIESERPQVLDQVIVAPLAPDQEDLSGLAAAQAQLDRLQFDLPAVARAIRAQREEEDIELLLMSL